MFKIRKYYLGMAIYNFFFGKFTSMQDLENNNWVILDALTNICQKC